MKTTLYLFIISFICVLSLGSICCAADPNKSLFPTRRKAAKAIGLSPAADSGSIQRNIRSTSPLSGLRRGRSVYPYTLVTPSLLPEEPEARTHASSDVSVTCFTTDFVVRVNPGFYGLGADAQELTLGSECRSNGVLRPQGDLLFTYPLTACDGERELPHGFLVYKYVLHYEPSPERFPSRAHQIDVNIECHYQRDHSVYQLAVQPDWQTVILRKTLKGRPRDFQINLMDDSWITPAKSQVYLLGQAVNIQVSAPHLPPGLKIYINSCYAAPTSGSKSSLKYILIDNFGCMLDSKHDPGSSQFVSRTDKTVRFSLRTFQFTADPDINVSIHCKLSVTSESPGPTHKSCTYKDHRWRALTGQDSICECCESTCVTSKPQGELLEGFATSRPLLVSDQPYTADTGHQQLSPSAIGRRREDEDELHYKDLKDNKNVWEGAVDEKNKEGNDHGWLGESDATHGAKTGLEELTHRRRVLEDQWSEPKLSDLEEFGEGVSGLVQEDFSENGKMEDAFKASEGELFEKQTIPVNHKDAPLHPRGHMGVSTGAVAEVALKPHNTQDSKRKKHACRGNVDRGRMPLNEEVDKQEETWYFTWT